jgi:hypothetical protein
MAGSSRDGHRAGRASGWVRAQAATETSRLASAARLHSNAAAYPACNSRVSQFVTRQITIPRECRSASDLRQVPDCWPGHGKGALKLIGVTQLGFPGQRVELDVTP